MGWKLFEIDNTLSADRVLIKVIVSSMYRFQKLSGSFRTGTRGLYKWTMNILARIGPTGEPKATPSVCRYVTNNTLHEKCTFHILWWHIPTNICYHLFQTIYRLIARRITKERKFIFDNKYMDWGCVNNSSYVDLEKKSVAFAISNAGVQGL